MASGQYNIYIILADIQYDVMQINDRTVYETNTKLIQLKK